MSFPAYPEHAAMMSISGQHGLWKSLSSGDMMEASQNGTPEDVPAEHKSQKPTIVEPPSTEEGCVLNVYMEIS
ncbi:hypothetical protein DCAR_0830553 [Daucus carota subsp. sativus]|uniref:Uncharacterized protein n=1 Tax=Daucus carota subsp. sativus TaxID=79200 RepID=A0A175YKZ4_DAUCS|nr:hypothetical protein DCAR_0830553 [Daucus carota subsp. sativus]